MRIKLAILFSLIGLSAAATGAPETKALLLDRGQLVPVVILQKIDKEWVRIQMKGGDGYTFESTVPKGDLYQNVK